MAELFGRRVRVTVGVDIGIEGQAIAFEDLDVDFRVTRDKDPEPNKAEVRLYNLRPERRQQVEEQDEIIVKVEAGYEGDLQQILLADMRTATTQRDGADLVTTLELEDGGRAYRRARTNRSFSPGTSLPDMMDRLRQDMGLQSGDVGELASAAFEGLGSALSGGSVLSGKASEEMTKLTESAGLEWSIQDRKLQVLRRGTPLDDTAIRLAPETGLVGSPELSSKGVLSAQTLMIPDMIPGRQVKVEGENVSGFFRLEKVETRGGTRDMEWGHRIEAKRRGQS